MSSVHAAPSQVPAYSAFIVAAGATGRLYDEAGTVLAYQPPAESILLDMGKTVRLGSGSILRKVQVSLSGAGDGPNGYMFVTALSAGDATKAAAQNISRLF